MKVKFKTTIECLYDNHSVGELRETETNEWFFYATEAEECFTPSMLRDIANMLESLDKDYQNT